MTKVIAPKVINTNTEETIRAKDIASELHKPIIKSFERRKVVAVSVDEIWGIDLCEMPNQDGYKYILTIVDVYSKYGWAIPLTTKTGKTVSEVFENLITHSHRKPKFLWSDLGKEFINKDFKEIAKKNEIEMYTTQSELKCTVIERFNRTLKDKMEFQFTLNKLLGKQINWVEILSKIVHDYNRNIHSTIKMRPVDAIKPENKEYLDQIWFEHLYGKIERKKQKFNEGDYVRIYKWKSTFEKGYKPRWTEEVFRIRTVQNTSPITYIIEDENGEEIKGAFYTEELLPTKSTFKTLDLTKSVE